jgi:hypothetical protein
LRANFQDSLPLALCLLVFPIPYYITHTGLRYRHPIDPFLTILTMYVLFRLFSTLRRRVVLGGSEDAVRMQVSSPAGAACDVIDRLANSPLQR